MRCIIRATKGKFGVDKYKRILEEFDIEFIRCRYIDWYEEYIEDANCSDICIINIKSLEELEKLKGDLKHEIILYDITYEMDYFMEEDIDKLDCKRVIEIYDGYRE